MKVKVSGSVVSYNCPGCRIEHEISSKIWEWNGDLDRPTFSPSILAEGYSRRGEIIHCHHYVKEGKIEFLNDCHHDLRGQTLDLEDIDGSVRIEGGTVSSS